MLRLCLLLAAVALLGTGCGDKGPGGRLTVVAGESAWGSIAAQLAGPDASTTSIVSDPGTDPHDYEPTTRDARTLAMSRLAIVNGIGYDPWMSQTLGATPDPGRKTLDVGKLLGLKRGANPHQWYAPTSVHRFVDAVTAMLTSLDPGRAAAFAARRRTFLGADLAEYNRLRAAIRARYAGVPVGYSESIFAPLGADLGLTLATPAGFADAVSEGTELSAQDKRTVDEQLQDRRVAVWVYNRQNATPEVQAATKLARARGIPVVTVTETLDGPSFAAWQTAQLRALADALHEATGR